ncbi:hypothetical protein GYMLUDRAFT_248826 [Collybiopsis luxurians FD-317 M1]|uniref:Uncharacterized protein n=1 Tax=Collybiopsis luxurians FD-317 M1 TaxID=944289 RepID=A0A0D0CAZ6_9AGAR|nr:hypothetical protein GYMLUDRAFT_248826 [Collybiopsis luxurians FD-317 M1]
MSSSNCGLLEKYSGISPLVNEELLYRFDGCYVRLPCRLLLDHGETITVLASDGGEVSVQINDIDRQTICPFTLYLEILGKVCVASQQKCFLADVPDLQLINRTVKIIHNHPRSDEIFNISGQPRNQGELGAYTEPLPSQPGESSKV